MNPNKMLFALAGCVFLWYLGYRFIALIAGAAVIFYAIRSGTGTVAPTVRGAGTEILEPIVIESTRGPPFIVPSSMKFYVKPDSFPQAWWERAVRKHSRLPRVIGMMLRGKKIYEEYPSKEELKEFVGPD